MEPVLKRAPQLKPFFVLFIVFSSWAMLSIMTGVVSENMIVIRQQVDKDNAENDELQRRTFNEALYQIFHAADVDGSGSVSSEEFDQLLDDQVEMRKLHKFMQKHKLNVRFRKQDMRELFKWIDVNNDGELEIDELLEGFRWMNEPVAGKSLVKLENIIIKEFAVVEDELFHILTDNSDEMGRPCRKVGPITSMAQSIEEGGLTARTAHEGLREVVDSSGRLAATCGRLQAGLDAMQQDLYEVEDMMGAVREANIS